jgi:hypothetical protein
MITGHPPYFWTGIWNCTYICPIVIWCGRSGGGVAGTAVPGGGGVTDA